MAAIEKRDFVFCDKSLVYVHPSYILFIANSIDDYRSWLIQILGAK